MWRDQRRLVAAALKNLGAVKSAGPRRERMQARLQTGARAAIQVQYVIMNFPTFSSLTTKCLGVLTETEYLRLMKMVLRFAISS